MKERRGIAGEKPATLEKDRGSCQKHDWQTAL
jgi:hypothetical protein